MLQHRFVFTLPAQTLPEISTFFFVCLSLPQSPTEFTFHFPIPSAHLFTKCSHCNIWISEIWRRCICGLQLCWQNSHGSMHAFPANNQTISCFFKSWAQSSRKLLYADNCSIINQTAVRVFTNPKQLVRSDQIYWCISLFNCSAYLKNSEDFGVDGSVMDKIYTTV